MAVAVNIPVPGRLIVPICRLTEHHSDRQSEAADLFSVSAIMTEDRADKQGEPPTHAHTHAHTHTHTGPTGRIINTILVQKGGHVSLCFKMFVEFPPKRTAGLQQHE